MELKPVFYDNILLKMVNLIIECAHPLHSEGSSMVELVRALVVCHIEPRFKSGLQIIFLKMFISKIVWPSSTLSSVLMKDQHVKACLHVGCSLSFCG